MKVLVAGATGVIGARLIPQLTVADHEVVEVSRASGIDLLDRRAVHRAVQAAEPDAVVHMATAIPAQINPKKMARQFEQTNRLRSEGTRNLLDAAQESGAPRVITQGLAYAYQPGQGPADEDAPLWTRPPAQFAPVLAALEEMERRTRDAKGLVLRFGHLYGPGSFFSPGGSYTRQVLEGKFPIAGKGGSVLSFTHASDAASAVVAALDSDVSGVLNIVDDMPVTIREWLPAFASMLGAPTPKHVPAALVRIAAGGWGTAFMTELRGANNARAKTALNWCPQFPSWIEGFRIEHANGLVGNEGARYTADEQESVRGSHTSARLLPAVGDHAATLEDRLHLLELPGESLACEGAGKGEEQRAEAPGLDVELDRQAGPPAAI